MQHVITTSSSSRNSLERKFDKSLSSVSSRSLVNMYLDPPQVELTLDEFELLSLGRLEMLRKIELIKTKGYDEKDFTAKLYDLEKKVTVQSGLEVSRLDDIQRDTISHFIMRLAYCRSEELRRWFLTQECTLLKYRLDSLSDRDRSDFMAQNGLVFDEVSNDEKNEREELLVGIGGITHTSIHKTNYYKVPFTQALSMVHTRNVYLERGFAYVPLTKLVSIIVTRFRMHLSKALVEASNVFDFVSGDSRIGPLLSNMNKQFTGNDFSGKAAVMDKLTPAGVEVAANVNMPLCMKNLHINLKKEGKIKHWGRLQYGLFLKGAGLDLEGANQFWESYFTKVMAHDEFVKKYAYSFRHMYGKEGARKNYTPYSCMKIIVGTPPEAGAHHGCPYKHMGDSQLSAMLSTLKISQPDAKEIVGIAKTSQYQLACQKHFEITHPGHQNMPNLKNSDGVANHPNQWFQVSVNYHKIKNGEDPEAKSEVKVEGEGGAEGGANSARAQVFNPTAPPATATATATATVTAATATPSESGAETGVGVGAGVGVASLKRGSEEMSA